MLQMFNKKDLLSLTNDQLDSVVKIQGTKFDRKRKVNENVRTRMINMASRGDTYCTIAKKLGYSPSTVRYIIDEDFRRLHNIFRDGAHTGVTHISKSDRAAYKRKLVQAGAGVIVTSSEFTD
jgi:transposase-like protein